MKTGNCGAILYGIELSDEYYPEDKLLKYCPYNLRKRGWKYDVVVPIDEILSQKCPECPLSGFTQTGNRLFDETRAYIKILLPDETETTRRFIAEEAYTRLPDHIPGYSWAGIMLASIYLTLKCPSNSDTPLTIKEIREKVTPFTTPTSRREIPKCVKLLREQGLFPEICIVSPLQHIVSRKKTLRKHLSLEEYELVRDTAKKLEKNQNYRKWKQGRRPTTLAAATVYATLVFYNIKRPMSNWYILPQREIAKIFNLTDVSIRNNYEIIIKFLEEASGVAGR